MLSNIAWFQSRSSLANPNLLELSRYYARIHYASSSDFCLFVFNFRVNLRLGFHSAALFREESPE